MGVREGKIGDGSDIILWHCSRKNHEFAWDIVGEYIKLRSHPDMCLSVREGKAGDGSDIILWRCADQAAFKWLIDGEHIKFKADPRYWLQLLVCLGSAVGYSGHQRWIISNGLLKYKTRQ